MEEFDIIADTTEYKSWEDIPVSQLNFKSETSQICYIAIDKSKALERISEISLPINTVAYEYSTNINKKDNEVIIAVEIDTSNIFDTTDLINLPNGNINNASVIRAVKPITKLGTTNYIIVYIIRDNRAVKNMWKI